MSNKIRLDLHLLTKGFAESRQKAQQLIRSGQVRDLNGKLLDKPGQEVSTGLEVKVKESPRFVSRGGEKLAFALQNLPVLIDRRVCLDAGISTGGFTDCLLQNGAKRVYGVDVGYGQIAWTLRNDSRVTLFERTNLRYLTPEALYKTNSEWASLAVADLSFISLKLVIPVIRSLLKGNDSEALLLVKPQFEVGKERVGKGGVVRDVNDHIDALNAVIDCAKSIDWNIKGLIPSPLTGPAGNHEYLIWLGTSNIPYEPDLKTIVEFTLGKN